MKTIAIVPARCGSKGIPNKNIYPINNKPLITYIIDALKNSIVDDIYVSTDCDAIASIVLNNGVKVIDRPINISVDSSPTIDCIIHAINDLKLDNNDTVVIAQPTSPLINSIDITNGIDTFNLSSHDSIIAVTQSHYVLWQYSVNSYIIPYNHDPKYRVRRQDMSPVFAETGGFYISKVSSIIKHNTIYGIGNVGYIEIPKSRSFEIDSYDDVFIVESILKNT